MPIHIIIYVYTYVCALLAAHIQAHLWGWRSAHREVGRSVSPKCNCQAVMGSGGQPRALLVPGRQTSQRKLQFVLHTTWPRSLTGMPKQRRKEKRGADWYFRLWSRPTLWRWLPWTMLLWLSTGQPSFNFNSGTNQIQQHNCEKAQ